MQPGGPALGGWSDSRVLSVGVGGVAAVAIAASAWIYAAHLPTYGEGPVRSDGVG